MTNPHAAMRMLITYAILIPLAILVGFLLTNPLDYGTLGFLAFILVLVISPVFIKWHYPILIFGLGCPVMLFFLPTNPPTWEVVVAISLGLSVIERILNPERRFLSVPAMSWPLLFLLAVIIFTMQLTGGIGFHRLGSSTGGGQKYMYCFLGIATFFALASRGIPREKRNLYLFLFFFSTALDVLGDIAPRMPAPISYINLLIPPSQSTAGQDVSLGSTRLGMLAAGLNAILCWMLAKYGLRGILLGGRLWRLVAFAVLGVGAQLGGFREALVMFVIIFSVLFFLEKIHRSRAMVPLLFAGIFALTLLMTFSLRLPIVYQRALAVIPLVKVDTSVRIDAQGSSDWRVAIWKALTPQIPRYLLLGKGYSISAEDFNYMGGGAFAGVGDAASTVDASQQALALSGDYHSGPFSTIIPFGIWGTIGMIWLMIATWWVVYRNYKHGDPELRTLNAYLLAVTTAQIVLFLFVMGAFPNQIGAMAKLAGLSVAFNWGVAKPAPKPVSNPRIKPLSAPASMPQTAG